MTSHLQEEASLLLESNLNGLENSFRQGNIDTNMKSSNSSQDNLLDLRMHNEDDDDSTIAISASDYFKNSQIKAKNDIFNVDPSTIKSNDLDNSAELLSEIEEEAIKELEEEDETNETAAQHQSFLSSQSAPGKQNDNELRVEEGINETTDQQQPFLSPQSISGRQQMNTVSSPPQGMPFPSQGLPLFNKSLELYVSKQRDIHPCVPTGPCSRRFFGWVLALLATGGVALAFLVPKGSYESSAVQIVSKNVDNFRSLSPTISSKPSSSFPLRLSPRVRPPDVVESQVSNQPSLGPTSLPENLRQVCNDMASIFETISTGGTFDQSCDPDCLALPDEECLSKTYQTVQQRALNHLYLKDKLYQGWMSMDKVNRPPEERIAQRYIMVVIAMSFNIDNWEEKEGWLDEEISECEWTGIVCDTSPAYTNMTEGINLQQRLEEMEDANLVKGIKLNDNGLSGLIPLELFKLRHLTWITLHNNKIGDIISPNISHLKNLEKLWLENNEIIGTIPTEIGSINSMKSLFLGNNNLSSTIPTELGRLAGLERLSLELNDLTGKIPTEITTCTSLKGLYIGGNYLSGTIPENIGDLELIADFRMNSNKLNGTLPSSLSELSNLTVLYLFENDLSGVVDDSLVSSWKELEIIDVGYNSFNGDISNEFGLLPELIVLSLNDNKFSSQIPDNICESGLLEKLDLSNNDNITGSVPDGFYNCVEMSKLLLNGNKITGKVPGVLSNFVALQELRLESNLLSGQIEDSLCSKWMANFTASVDCDRVACSNCCSNCTS